INGHSNSFGFLAIDFHQLLRIVGSEAGEQTPEIMALVAAGNNFVRDRVDVLHRIAAQVLQLELKSAEAPNAIDGGRLEGNHDRSRNAEEFRRDARDNVAGGVALAFAIIYWL